MGITVEARRSPVAVESREEFARRTILHAFEHNPEHVWTRENLATWYAIPLLMVEEILAEMLGAGSIHRVVVPTGGFRATRLRSAV